MAYEYVDCESNIKISLCMNTNCMCERLCDKISVLKESKRIECAVYSFRRDGLFKYGYGTKIRNLSEEEARKITII